MKTRTYLETLVAANVRELRERRGYTQPQLAEKMGTLKYRVSEIERGVGGVTLDSLHRIANALGVAPWELLQSASPEPDRACPKMDIQDVVAKNIAGFRHRRGYTCEQLGDLIGRYATRVTEAERKRYSMMVAQLERFAYGLSVPAWALVHPDGMELVD